MKFGSVPLASAEGAILAHSLNINGLQLRKGRILNAADIVALMKEGISDVIVAKLDTDDIGEDEAAKDLGISLVPDAEASFLQISEPFTGRVNIYAKTGGVVQIDEAAINQFNAISPSITVATVRNMTRVAARSLVATVKIIPYAVARKTVEAVTASAALQLTPSSF